MHFVGNESFNVQIKASFYHLIENGSNSRPGSTYNANPRWRQANPQPDSTESVAAISDVDAEKTLRKSFDKTMIKKG